MKRLTQFALLCLSTVFLSACGQNPVGKLTPDEFAQAVNRASDKADITDEFKDCATYYANPKEGDSDLVKNCPGIMDKLAKTLKNEKGLESITQNDLTKKSTWEQYFKSKYHRGMTAHEADHFNDWNPQQ